MAALFGPLPLVGQQKEQSWLEDMLEEKGSGSKEMKSGKEASGQTLSNSPDPAFVEELIRYGHKLKPSSRSGVRVYASAAQLRDNKNWQTLGVEEAILHLTQSAEGRSVDNFICILQKCRKTKNLEHAKRVHMQICSNGLEADRALGNYLVPMFVECGSLSDAQQVFNRLDHRNEYSWTSLIQGYIESGESQYGLDLFQKMQTDCVQPSRYTLLALLKACARLKCVERGREVHAEIAKEGYERDLFVGSTLVDMYGKCGMLAEAWEVLEKLPVRDVVAWNAILTGYAEHGLSLEVLNCFQQMQFEGIPPTSVTFLCSMKACSSLRAIDRAQEIYTEIVKQGCERDLFIGNTLVDMYAKCSSLAEAQEVFDKLAVRDVVSWSALIAGYAEHDLGEEVLNCLGQMKLEGVHPDAVTCVCSLKACTSIGAIDRCREVHTEIAKHGYGRDSFVGNTLVDMYAKCGSLAEAQEVFDKLSIQNVVSWTALIAGYAEHGLGEQMLNCLEQMQLKGMSLDAITFVCILKGCGSIGAINRGREMHAEIAKEGFERDLSVGNTLVDMYMKCGLLAEAWEVFDKLPVKDAVSWNALMAGYSEHGLGEEALICLEEMQLEGVLLTSVTLVCSLKACGSIGAIDTGRKIHAEIVKEGLKRDPFVCSSLVDMYAQCGLFGEAEEVFDKLPVRDVVLWNTLLAAYAERGLGEESLNCLKWMNMEGSFPDAITFVCSLKACGCRGSIDRGREIHAEIAKWGFEPDPFVGNGLVDMYAKCGSLAEAQEVFDKLPVQNVISWNTIITGCVEHGFGEEALNCFQQMQLGGVSPDAVTFVCSLKACGSIGAIDRGQKIHTKIAKWGYDSDSFVGNMLVDMYARLGLIVEAWKVFDKLPMRDVVSWTVLIARCVEHELNEEALDYLEQMQLEGVSPNVVTLVCSLKACGSIKAIDRGREIHAEVAKQGYGSDVLVGKTLMVMYAKWGSLAEAQKVFDKLPDPDVILWNALIVGYAEHGLGEEALNCLEQMQLEGVSPNAVTFACSLRACGSIGAMDRAREIHFHIYQQGFERDPYVGNTLVNIYAKGGSLAEAQEVFDMLPVQDVVSWTTLIAGYAEHGLGEEALNCLEQMQLESVSPDAITFICILKACGSIGAIDRGREIHAEIAKEGFERDSFVGKIAVDGYAEQGDIENPFQFYSQMQQPSLPPNSVTFVSILEAFGNTISLEIGEKILSQIYLVCGLEAAEAVVENTLIDMYGKCGSMVDAQQVFDTMPTRTLVTWNALITGYARRGESEIVFNLFERMEKEGVQPDGITFLSALTVCSHVGLVDKGQKYFEDMSKEYGIIPTIKHHNCMVDILSRAGQLDEVVAALEKLSFQPDLVTWSTLLGACRKWDEVEFGRQVFECAVRLDEKHPSAFISMSNIYVGANMQDMGKIEEMRVNI